MSEFKLGICPIEEQYDSFVNAINKKRQKNEKLIHTVPHFKWERFAILVLPKNAEVFPQVAEKLKENKYRYNETNYYF
jgi:hypothetical protein